MNSDNLQTVSILLLSFGVLLLIGGRAGSGHGRGPSIFDGLGMELGSMFRPLLPVLGLIATGLMMLVLTASHTDDSASASAVEPLIRYAALGAIWLGFALVFAGVVFTLLDRLGVIEHLARRSSPADESGMASGADEGGS